MMGIRTTFSIGIFHLEKVASGAFSDNASVAAPCAGRAKGAAFASCA
jgi:hypothetical protein